jgi:hypothetical protein
MGEPRMPKRCRRERQHGAVTPIVKIPRCAASAPLARHYRCQPHCRGLESVGEGRRGPRPQPYQAMRGRYTVNGPSTTGGTGVDGGVAVGGAGGVLVGGAGGVTAGGSPPKFVH